MIRLRKNILPSKSRVNLFRREIMWSITFHFWTRYGSREEFNEHSCAKKRK